MIEKWKKIINSPRFQQVTLGAISAYLGLVATHGFVLSELLMAISVWLGAVALIGTVDSAATKSAQVVTVNKAQVDTMTVNPPGSNDSV